jgi:hypothetical protein
MAATGLSTRLTTRACSLDGHSAAIRTPRGWRLVKRADSAHIDAVIALAIGSERAERHVHATGGLVVLLATTVLAIYKPAGRTRYGWRKHEELQRASPPSLSGTP